MRQTSANEIIRWLVGEMQHRYATSRSPDEWEDAKAEALADHTLRDIAHSCPLTYRSFSKPRGYAGDAPTLDYIYGIETAETRLPKQGTAEAAIFSYTSNSPACRAVRYRCRLIGTLVDEVARRRPGARVISIACGHLREFQHSKASNEGLISEWVALDQDRRSVSYLREAYPDSIITPMTGTIRQLIAGRYKPEHYDFVYSAGLFDYLDDLTAKQLTSAMYDMLAPGGDMLIANFAPKIPDAGYMESFMDWSLIWRTQDNLSELARSVPLMTNEIQSFTDPDHNIHFLKATKPNAQ